MTESAVMLLPEPLSPTMPTVSPCITRKLTPSTARTVPAAGGKWVARSMTSRTGTPSPCGRGGGEGFSTRSRCNTLTPALSRREREQFAPGSSPLPRLRIEPIAYPVAQEVEAEHDAEDRKARERR